ncbi:hypothetical protein [Paenibacillus taichungensis]|uniref:hypothetical protein n=1 Tax=Paenibacillus taichungensis TaxID=484184 RepID=UPI0039A34E7A
MKKKGGFKMSPTTLADFKKRKEAKSNRHVKQVKKLTQKQMQESIDFKRRSWERD